MDMSHHRLGLCSVIHLREGIHDLILAERATVELVDALFDHHTGLLLHQLRKLAGVVLLHRNDPLRATQNVADALRRERFHETALKEVDLLALRLEHLERVEDRALCRAPCEHGELSVLGTMQEELLLLRARVLGELELAYAL